MTEILSEDALKFSPGAIIANRFKVLQTLGTGGMGTVVRAIDLNLENEVIALKLLNPHLVQDKSMFKRFRREVLLSRQLTHPNIVRIHDVGHADGIYFISMEFVPGITLRERVKNSPGGKLQFAETMRILHELCQGIAYAHQKGIIHRDLKPDNVLITDAGAVKIVDFGFAETIWQGSELTPVGETVGTPYYMAPEQIRGDNLDHRCDIYAIGIIAFELISGRRPFEDKSWFNLATKHLQEPIPELSESMVPEWFFNIILKATAKDKNMRFKSAEELALVLMQPSGGGAQTVDRSQFAIPDQVPTNYGTRLTAFYSAKQAIKRFNYKIFIFTAGIIAVMATLVAEMKANQSVREQVAGLREDIGKNVPKDAELIQKRAPDARDFFAAINSGDSAYMGQLIDAGVSPDTKNEYGEYALHVAVNSGNVNTVTTLLERGADSGVTDKDGRTPLMLAVRANNTPMFLKLAEGDRTLNYKDNEGRTALIYAILADNLGMVRTLISQGALVNIMDNDGMPPLIHAAKLGRVDIVKELKGAGADLSTIDRDGRTALEYAQKSGNSQLIAALSPGEEPK